MKNIILLKLLLLYCVVGYGQKYKSERIYDKGSGVNFHVVSLRTNMDENNTVISKEFILCGQNPRYTRITDITCVYDGDFDGLIDFLQTIENFYNENELDVHQEIDNMHFRRARHGVEIKKGVKYFGIDIKSLNNIKKTMTEWSAKNLK